MLEHTLLYLSGITDLLFQSTEIRKTCNHSFFLTIVFKNSLISLASKE